MSMALI
jgi:hypothetical protein